MKLPQISFFKSLFILIPIYIIGESYARISNNFLWTLLVYLLLIAIIVLFVLPQYRYKIILFFKSPKDITHLSLLKSFSKLVLTFICLIALYLVLDRSPLGFVLDASNNKEWTLAPKTKQFLKQIQIPITIHLITQKIPSHQDFVPLFHPMSLISPYRSPLLYLKLYALQNHKIKIQYGTYERYYDKKTLFLYDNDVDTNGALLLLAENPNTKQIAKHKLPPPQNRNFQKELIQHLLTLNDQVTQGNLKQQYDSAPNPQPPQPKMAFSKESSTLKNLYMMACFVWPLLLVTAGGIIIKFFGRRLFYRL